jgi:hypothetical protein
MQEDHEKYIEESERQKDFIIKQLFDLSSKVSYLQDEVKALRKRDEKYSEKSKDSTLNRIV